MVARDYFDIASGTDYLIPDMAPADFRQHCFDAFCKSLTCTILLYNWVKELFNRSNVRFVGGSRSACHNGFHE